MKTASLSIGIIFLFVAMVCSNCTKEESSLFPEGELLMLKQAKTSDYIPGIDITEQLRSDLEKGLSVTLPAGHFYLSESIYIYGYPGGTIKGAGKDATIIEASPGFKVTEQPGFPPGYGISSMLEIHAEGDVTCKAFSILVEGDHPAEGHTNPFYGGYYSTNIDNVITLIGDGISLECKDLRIKGEYVGDVEGAYNGYNVSWPIIGTGYGEPGLFNHLSVKNCVIEGAGGAAIDLWMGTTAELKDNVISNSDVGVMLLDNPGMQTVKDCHFSNISSSVFFMSNIELYCFKDNLEDGLPMPDDCQ